MTPRRHVAAVGSAIAVVALLGVLLAGCGGSSTPSLSRYADQARAICRSYGDKLRADADQPGAASDRAGTARVLARALQLGEQGSQRLDALRLPRGDAVLDRAALRDQQVQLADLRAVQTAVRSGDHAAVRAALARFEADSPVVDQAFDAAGISACGAGNGSH